MIKKNGFISISIVYSFFVVFMLLLVLIMASYVNNRNSLNVYKKDIKANLASGSTYLQIAYKDIDINNKQNMHPYYLLNIAKKGR